MTIRLKPTLKPTLWRTCRVLANRVRLRMLQALFRKGDLAVSDVAAKAGVSTAVASEYLRAVGARGLLASRREGRLVYYRPAADPSVRGSAELLRALRKSLRRGRKPIDATFRLVTAFTHPRRIEIARALAAEPLAADGLARRTGISRFALQRHLVKLSRRGLVMEMAGTWRLAHPRGSLVAALLRLACER